MDLEIKRDRFLYPIRINSGDKFVFGTTDVLIPAGTYYAHMETSLTGYPSLYQAIITALQSAFVGRTFTIKSHTPGGYKLAIGIMIQQLSGSAIGSLNLASTTPTLRQVLGFGRGQTDTIAWSGNYLYGEISAFGQWVPWSLFEGRASSKDSYISRVTEWSSSHPEVATAIVWRERTLRVLKYEYVFGVYIYNDRSSFDDLAYLGGLAPNDSNIAFENLWLECGRENSTIIVVYDLDDIDFEVTDRAYEYVRLTQDKVSDMDSVATRLMLAHDYWNLNLSVVVIGGNGYGL